MSSTMTQIQQLASGLMAAYQQGADAVIKFFNPDATIEFPFASSIGGPVRLTVAAFREYLSSSLPKMSGLEFSGFRLHKVEDQDAYWAEAHATATLPRSGRPYLQDYVTYAELNNGKIQYYKEYWNILPILNEQADK